MHKNILYLADNLEIMRTLPSKSIDLICTDPPFNSNENYNVPVGAESQKQAFIDTWSYDSITEELREYIIQESKENHIYKAVSNLLTGFDAILQGQVIGNKGAMRSYLTFMAPRIIEMHRLLKDTGTIYFHCDPSASHYLKVLMDAIFDQNNRSDNKNFMSEIIWGYHGNSGSRKKWPRKHDVLLVYTKSNQFTYHPTFIPYTEKDLKRYKETDSDGKRFFWNKNRTAGRYKTYMKEGKLVGDVWKDILPIQGGKESLNYSTQKPIELYERIIAASSNEDDIVFDPFMGSGTTIDAAQKLNRKWIGIDITIFALEKVKNRLLEKYNLNSPDNYIIKNYPTSMEEIWKLKKQGKHHDIANWAVTKLNLEPTDNIKDGGFDGIGWFKILNQVKQEIKEIKVIAEVKTGEINMTQVRAFCDAINFREADLGIFISLDKKTRTMKQKAADMKHFRINNKNYPRLQFWQITEDFFKNREFINENLELPFRIDSTKIGNYTRNNQMEMNLE